MSTATDFFTKLNTHQFICCQHHVVVQVEAAAGIGILCICFYLFLRQRFNPAVERSNRRAVSSRELRVRSTEVQRSGNDSPGCELQAFLKINKLFAKDCRDLPGPIHSGPLAVKVYVEHVNRFFTDEFSGWLPFWPGLGELDASIRANGALELQILFELVVEVGSRSLGALNF